MFPALATADTQVQDARRRPLSAADIAPTCFQGSASAQSQRRPPRAIPDAYFRGDCRDRLPRRGETPILIEDGASRSRTRRTSGRGPHTFYGARRTGVSAYRISSRMGGERMPTRRYTDATPIERRRRGVLQYCLRHTTELWAQAAFIRITLPTMFIYSL